MSSPTDGFGFQPAFADKLDKLLAACTALGLEFRISQGLRPPKVQAEYYCKWAKRSPQDIDDAARTMEDKGAPWLADLLKSFRAIPRQKAWLTSQLPGSGWHQWGEAADCYCYENGKMVSKGSDPRYKKYAEAAKKLGLTPGLYFSKPDAGHVQLRPQAGATNVYTWSYIDAAMKERFSEKPGMK